MVKTTAADKFPQYTVIWYQLKRRRQKIAQDFQQPDLVRMDLVGGIDSSNLTASLYSACSGVICFNNGSARFFNTGSS